MKEPLHSNKRGGNVLSQRGKGKESVVKLKEEEKRFLRRLALRIRDLRINAGVTQEKFYEDTNIHIGRIETGKLNISVNTLFRICDYFKISVKEFFEEVKKR